MLALLDVLGMTDKRTVEFTDDEYHVNSTQGVSFSGQEGKKRIRFRISREALDDHFSDHDRLRPEAAFKKHRAGDPGTGTPQVSS